MLNAFNTKTQQIDTLASLKMVGANIDKELQNGLPKCNPFVSQIEYHIYRDGVGTQRAASAVEN
jgi:hypothetical protein